MFSNGHFGLGKAYFVAECMLYLDVSLSLTGPNFKLLKIDVRDLEDLIARYITDINLWSIHPKHLPRVRWG